MMSRFFDRFSFPCDPQAAEDCAFVSGDVRLSVLAPALLRVEVSRDGTFCDEPTQSVWFRNFDRPNFTVKQDKDEVILKTDAAEFRFSLAQKRMKKIVLADGRAVTDFKKGNLKGTCRTLDQTNGFARLGQGVVSESGVAVLDDSDTQDREVREAAAKKITDRKMLTDLARAYCPEAVMAIDDPDVLYRIAETTSFFIDKDCSIEYKTLRAVDKNFSIYGDPWYTSPDVPAGEERLRDIRKTEKMFGLALLALKMLKEKGSDRYLCKLMRNSMYDMVREQAAEEIIKRDSAAARAIVSDRSLRKHVRQKAFLQAEDPQLRSEYCGELDMHNWEQISQSSNTIGDHLYIKERYRCIYCGRTKSEEESRLL